MTDEPNYFECEDCIGMREHGCYCFAIGAVAPGGPIKGDSPVQAIEDGGLWD